jgi:cation transport protein ChaC
MWNPCFEPLDSGPASIAGYERQFCILTTRARGTPQRPGLGLGLVPGAGSCRGIAYRLDPANLDADLQALFEREMGTGVYRPTWLEAEKGSACVDVLAFVVDQNHPQYAGKLGTSEMVDRIVGAAGSYGSCRDYLAKTVVEMTRIGVPEPGFETLLERVDSRLARISHQAAPNGDEGVEFKQGKRN